MVFLSERFQLRALRGAITSQGNTANEIEEAVNELIDELIKRNTLIPERIVSIIFSVTKDLNACFPASIARRQKGWENVSLLDCQQMHVQNDLKYCIRILAHVWLEENQISEHPYLKKARQLRPDR